VNSTINVNLAYNPRDPHNDEAQILIPCPIRRSVTFSVALGDCYLSGSSLKCSLGDGAHRIGCPARPVRVSCSISGKTWEESSISFVERADGECIGPMFDRVDTICRARWALVKALVLGQTYTLAARFPPAAVDVIHRLHIQRDAVFAALTDMARGQAIYATGNERLPEVCRLFYRGDPTSEALERYVEYLIEQVGILP
jgi:hypothetical protein